MDKAYERFLRSGISLAPLGAGPGGEACFCTPRGAEIIGGEGVDGVHYCFAPGYGGTVFAVSPENAAPDYVHAVARGFGGFLRLLLSCGHGAAIEQCWRMTREQFDAYLAENPVTDAQRAVMEELRARLGLEPMDDPWGYIHDLQAGFDYSGIEFTGPEYGAEARPEAMAEPGWAVYYGPRGDEPGRETPLMRDFRAFGERWTALALYFCQEGLVLHLAREVEPLAFRAFMERNGLSFADGGREYSVAERMRIEAENPLNLGFGSTLIINGERVDSSGGSGFGWISLPGAENPSRGWLEHYGLDRDYCWSFYALRFPRRGAQALESLALELRPDCVELPGAVFTAAEGESVLLRHPFTGAEYTLTALSAVQETVDAPDYPDVEFPRRCLAMSYAVEPEAPGLTLRDAREGDRARSKDGGCCAAATAVIASGGEGLEAASSLYFEPPENIEWLPVWRVERGGTETVELK